MTKIASSSALATALIALGLAATPAKANSFVTFVSGKGTDSGTCASPANPCRTFQFVIGQTSAGGGVKALDPAQYGPMTITKSISITGVEGASIIRNSGDAITINAGPNDTINLSHLIFDGLKLAAHGIVFNSGGLLTIRDCVVGNFFQGVFLQPSGKTNFLIADSVVTSSTNRGVLIQPQGTGSARGVVDHVSTVGNGHDGLGSGLID